MSPAKQITQRLFLVTASLARSFPLQKVESCRTQNAGGSLEIE
jgi:hypothetical protein